MIHPTDNLLTPQEMASKLQLTMPQLQDLTRSKKIPAVKFSQRLVRYHLPTVLKKYGCQVDAKPAPAI